METGSKQVSGIIPCGDECFEEKKHINRVKNEWHGDYNGGVVSESLSQEMTFELSPEQ